ncbi:MAG: hypothetical protein IKU93_00965 [Alistipes sp.]|nr:hypothetical protein [Alistipes sp.]
MKKLFYFLMALPLAFAACNETVDTPTEEPKKATLELTSAEVMEFEAEGGQGTITFHYDGNNLNTNINTQPSTGKSLAVECQAEWITVDREVDVLAAAINFEVAENDAEEAREATIKASIADLAIEVLVKQAAKVQGGDEPTDEFVEGWAINGTMNNWAKAEATAMTEEDNFFVVKNFALEADDNFNFILDGGVKNYGGNGQMALPNYVYEAKSWGSNISVAEAGEYDIYLSADLKNYYIMTPGTSPAEAETPLKPGEKRWTIKGDIVGSNGEEITLAKDSKYFTLKNVEFTGDAKFYLVCNSATTYGVAEGTEYAVESAATIIEGGEAIQVPAVEGQKYDIYYLYKESGKSQLWVMPAMQYPVVWELVSGGYMPYGNFLCYFVSEDVELTVDFTAGVSVENYVMPEGVYYVQDTENTGFSFDLQYCQAKIRGFKTMLMDGSMTVKHTDNGLYDVFIDMRTPQLDIIKMHWVGEFAFDSYFQMMGGHQIQNPTK